MSKVKHSAHTGHHNYLLHHANDIAFLLNLVEFNSLVVSQDLSCRGNVSFIQARPTLRVIIVPTRVNKSHLCRVESLFFSNFALDHSDLKLTLDGLQKEPYVISHTVSVGSASTEKACCLRSWERELASNVMV